MLCHAQPGCAGVSPSASRSIPMICSSLNLLFLIVLLLFLRSRTLPLSRPVFGGQVKPLCFLVRREGLKLTLVGRSQLPEIATPVFIPENLRKYYRNAIIADQTNFTLAAAL